MKDVFQERTLEDTRHHALLALLKTAGVIEKVGMKHFVQYGLTPAQYDVLIVLKLNGGAMTQVGLSRLLTASRANVTGLVDKLQEKKFIERKSVEGDRRSFAVTLTARGRKKVDEVEPLYLETVKTIMAPFSAEECKRIMTYTERLTRQLSIIGGDDAEG